MKFKNPKSPLVHGSNMINLDARSELCRLILGNVLWLPYEREFFRQKQNQIKQKNKEKITEYICSIFLEVKKCFDIHSRDEIFINVNAISQRVNAMPQLVDISSVFTLLCSKNYSEQIRNFYINGGIRGGFYTFFDVFATKVWLKYIPQLKFLDLVYTHKISLLARTSLYFLCDLWVCAQQQISYITKYAYMYNTRSAIK